MTPLYPVFDHPLLSQAARDLGPEVVTAETLDAETALDLLGTAYTGDLRDRIKGAVVRQVNLQIREPNGAIQSETRGSRSVTYVSRDGQEIAVDTLALLIAEEVAAAEAEAGGTSADAYTVCRSFR